MFFKVGDRVKVVKAVGKLAEEARIHIGKTGEIVDVLRFCTYPYGIEFEDGVRRYFVEEELDAVS